MIEITNNKAHKLLQDLEDLQIIKVLKKEMHEKQVNKSSTTQFRERLNLSINNTWIFKSILKIFVTNTKNKTADFQ